MSLVGSFLLWITLATTLGSILAGLWGLGRDSRRWREGAWQGAILSAVATGGACFVLSKALLTSDFRFAYVSQYTSRNLPLMYKVSAFWAGQAGSLLLWLAIISVLMLVVLFHSRYREDSQDIKVVTVINIVRLLFVVVLIWFSSPFDVLESVPNNGRGLNPMLQSFGMVVHPPLLFLGFSGFLIPFALAVTELWERRTPISWPEKSRPWVLFSWAVLTAGIVTGGQWAYTELGWGGYWAWDPVENASLFPWLTSTALLHTLLTDRQRRYQQAANFVLISLTFALTIFATFLTRSGILDSVHAFADGLIGGVFLAALTVILLLTGYLVGSRRQLLAVPVSQDRSSLCSRESAIGVGNALLFTILAGVWVGTMFPKISSLWGGREIALDETFFNQITVPFWLALIFVMGLAPVLEWGRAKGVSVLRRLALPVVIGLAVAVWMWPQSGLAAISLGIAGLALSTHLWSFAQHMRHPRAFLRQRRRTGAYLVHVGIILMLLGVTGSSLFSEEVIVTRDPGEQFAVGDYLLEYDGLKVEGSWLSPKVTAVLQVYEGDQYRGEVSSDKTFGQQSSDPATNIGILSNLRHDVYFHLAGWEGQRAQLQVTIFPLVSWIWIGSYVIYLGVLLILWPSSILNSTQATGGISRAG